MPVFMPGPWFIVVSIVLKSCTWLITGAAVGEKRNFFFFFFENCYNTRWDQLPHLVFITDVV